MSSLKLRKPARAHADLPVRPRVGAIRKLSRFQVVISARNEARLIGDRISRLRPELESGDEVHVIADHCTDGTAEIAASAGALVHVRNSGEAGKGASISWWIERSANSQTGWVFVLDADSCLEPGTMRRVRRVNLDQRCAYQLPICPAQSDGGSVGRLAGLSEKIDQLGFEGWLSQLGGSVRLRGTGMLIPRSLLLKYGADLKTNVEDAELTLRLLADGIPIRRLSQGAIIDPKPATPNAAVLQRGRWIRGQWELLFTQWRMVMRSMATGPMAWLTLEMLFVKPRSVMLPLKLLAAVLLISLSGGAHIALAGASLVIVWLTLDFYRLILGASRIPKKREFASILLSLPAFLWMWTRAFGLALRMGHNWPSAKIRNVEADMAESVRAT